MKTIPTSSSFKRGDLLILVGELFQRGYANGLVEAAEKKEMKIIYSTVGRRSKTGELLALNEEELKGSPQPLINIPLEAGFDMEITKNKMSLCELLKSAKPQDWETLKIPQDMISEAKSLGQQRFKKNLTNFIKELESHLTPGANVVFVHLMAGGIPRVKVLMPLLNRMFKGQNERYLSSEKFWQSELGKLCLESFFEVTADSYKDLIELTSDLRQKIEKQNGKVSYTSYGYHGTEIKLGSKKQWQSYAPYLQGWAKLRLENISKEFWEKNIRCGTYNCPEILTHSTTIFLGVELSLYALLNNIKESPHPKAKALLLKCEDLLKPEFKAQNILSVVEDYFSKPEIKYLFNFNMWPQHSTSEQLNLMLTYSDQLIQMHKDEKHLIPHLLSELTFKSAGNIILNETFNPRQPVWWLGHDVIFEEYLNDEFNI